ncbi:MAG: hypothetical protein KAS04_04465 [Candidatus Aenigmarchaeota archaeon]|nr:hypothetical protein [Candidatus Aenigmarchaeota archaeon]
MHVSDDEFVKGFSKIIRLIVVLFVVVVMLYFINPDIFTVPIEFIEDSTVKVIEDKEIRESVKDTCMDFESKVEKIKSGNVTKILVPYIGSLDGEISEEWLTNVDSHFIQFHLENEIPAALSIYATDLEDNDVFDTLLKKIYLSNCFEILQKGTDTPKIDMFLHKTPFYQQKAKIHIGKERLEEKINKLLPEQNVSIFSFNALMGVVNEDTMRALEELGFKSYFELYIGDDIEIMNQTTDFDVYQYSVGFPEDSESMDYEDFNTLEYLLNRMEEIASENRAGVRKFGNITIVPVFIENWDIEEYDNEKMQRNGIVNVTKWEMYKSAYLKFNSMNDTVIMTPSQIWEMKRM